MQTPSTNPAAASSRAPASPVRPAWRLLNRDGRFNAARKDPRRTHWAIGDHYHQLLAMSWPRFFSLLASGYLVINFTFALLYFAGGEGALHGARPDPVERFLDCFFFSVQTFATIGYGRMTPDTLFANLVATIEAFTGMLSITLPTGLLFARFSRPTTRVKFSEVALMSPHDGQPAFLFRMANERLNQIVEAQVRVILSRDEVTAEGERYRNFHELKLESDVSSIFVLTWTVVHPIDDTSPLYGVTPKELEESEAEIIVSLTGIDDTFSQTVHARYSYKPDEILWGRRFGDILERDREGGRVRIDLAGISRTEAFGGE